MSVRDGARSQLCTCAAAAGALLLDSRGTSDMVDGGNVCVGGKVAGVDSGAVEDDVAGRGGAARTVVDSACCCCCNGMATAAPGWMWMLVVPLGTSSMSWDTMCMAWARGMTRCAVDEM